MGNNFSQIDVEHKVLDTTLTQPPIANSLSDVLHKDGSYNYDNTEDSLEAISDFVQVIPTVSPVVSTQSGTVTGRLLENSVTGTPTNTQVTSGAANTFGAWTSLDPAMAVDAWINSLSWSYFGCDSAVGSILEIGMGAPASEVIIGRFTNYWIWRSAVGMYPSIMCYFNIPIKIASGVRLCARTAGTAAADIYMVTPQCYQGLEA